MKHNPLRTNPRVSPLPLQLPASDDFDLAMSEVESRNMPSIATSGWEITSILVILLVLLGVLYNHNF